MLKIFLSQTKALPFDFEKAVAAYVQELQDHRFTEDAAAPSVPHPLVAAAVSRKQHPIEDEKPDDFVADYEIVDDTPPKPSLDERKVAMANEVTRRANELLTAITPPLKAGLWNFQVSDAMITEESARTDTQKAVLDAHEIRRKQGNAIHRHLAQLHSDIHDLPTEEALDAWQPTPFPS